MIIEQKTTELSRYVSGKCQLPEFSEPRPELEGTDSVVFRRRILSLSRSEAQSLGIGKSVSSYLARVCVKRQIINSMKGD